MLPDKLKNEIQELLVECEDPQQAAVEALCTAVEHLGWVSDETIVELGLLLNMTTEELDSVASFYNHIYRRPVGRHVILLCESVTCWIMDYQKIRTHIRNRLGIDFAQTTDDGKFTLLPVQCLGACDEAPAMMIDGELYGNLDERRVDEILKKYE